MDLTLFFQPLPEAITQHPYLPSSVGQSVRMYADKMPDLRGMHMAILGVPDERGTAANQGAGRGPDEIRKKLYALCRGNQTYKIADLGNLRSGVDLPETYTRLSEVCRMLLEQNVLPLILGATHDLDVGQYRGYEQMEKLVSLLAVDAFLDLADDARAPASRRHLHQILLHEPNFLMGYTHLAHQLYLVDPQAAAVLEKLCFESYRLGQLRTDLAEMEPVIRQADMLSFDITAIKSADAPGNAHAQPFGLTGEEACQICWYAGRNEKLSSAGFYEYNPLHDDAARKTAGVAATMVWYFIEGFYHRKSEANFKGNDFVKYTVSMPVEPETISFYKSKFTDRWWMEVVVPGDWVYTRHTFVPCSYADYQTAARGELPNRYIQAMAKLL
jgi:formiminoglutamase